MGYRPDIQGLRALSVILVLVFHVFPAALPGGYVGVDVFFVISGFLITNILLKDGETHGRIRFGHFYLRRIRRLAPAATVTLAVAGLASLIILPKLYWRETALEILAATFYVENFFLYARSIDYWAEDNAPTLFQHYWSLSIEEQFYVFWPALIALTILVVKALSVSFRTGVLLLAGVVFAASLGASIAFTASIEGAYFLTHLRAWELALGALLAVGLPHLRLVAWLRTVLGFTGITMIVLAASTFNAQTVFPGYAALLPTFGAVFLLASGGQSGVAGLRWLLSNRVAQFLGDRSYSIYLVHWPLVIFATALGGGQISVLAGLGVFVLSIALADLSFRFVETPFRHGSGDLASSGLAGSVSPEATASLRKSRNWRTLFSGPIVLPAWTFALSLGCAGLLVVLTLDQDRLEASEIVTADYPGALVLLHPDQFEAREGVPFIPSPETARRDMATGPNGERPWPCTPARVSAEPILCSFGDTDADRRIMVVGDSHATHWAPAFDAIGDRNGVRVDYYVKHGCRFINVEMVGTRDASACLEWTQRVIEIISRENADLIIISISSISDRFIGEFLNTVELLADTLSGPVVVMGSTARMRQDIIDCVASNMGNPDLCGSARDEASRIMNNVQEALNNIDRAYHVDMMNALCSADRCEPVVGNILAYRDSGHLTATYVRTMTDELERQLRLIAEQDADRFGGPNRLFDPALVQ